MPLALNFETVGSGPPLLVLHGLFGSSSNWRSIARQLAATHTVFSVDLRNHGASPLADAMRGADVMAAASRAEVQGRLQQAVSDPGVVPFLMQNLVMHNAHFDWRINLMGISAAMPQLCGFPSELLGASYGGPVTVI